MFPVQLRLISIVNGSRIQNTDPGRPKMAREKKHSGFEELDGLFLKGFYWSREAFHVGKT
jgi:hypothetical protein